MRIVIAFLAGLCAAFAGTAALACVCDPVGKPPANRAELVARVEEMVRGTSVVFEGRAIDRRYDEDGWVTVFAVDRVLKGRNATTITVNGNYFSCSIDWPRDERFAFRRGRGSRRRQIPTASIR
jgi:hypothetical protein